MLSSRTASPPFGCYSFTVPPGIQGRVVLGGWLRYHSTSGALEPGIYSSLFTELLAKINKYNRLKKKNNNHNLTTKKLN